MVFGMSEAEKAAAAAETARDVGASVETALAKRDKAKVDKRKEEEKKRNEAEASREREARAAKLHIGKYVIKEGSPQDEVAAAEEERKKSKSKKKPSEESQKKPPSAVPMKTSLLRPRT